MKKIQIITLTVLAIAAVCSCAKAVKEGNKWILNGNKSMITNGGLAEVYCVLLKTSPTELSCFLVDQDMPGFKHGKREEFIGMTGTPVGEIFLENVMVTENQTRNFTRIEIVNNVRLIILIHCPDLVGFFAR